MSYLDNIYNSSNYEYLNPSQNRYGNLELDVYPATQVVTTAELKSQLRIDTSDEDTLLTSYILAATQMAEHYCNRHFINARYKIWYNEVPSSFSLYFPDVTLDFGTSQPATDDGMYYLSNLSTNAYAVIGNNGYYIKNANPYIFKKTSRWVDPVGGFSEDELDGANTGLFYFRFTTGMGTAASDVPDAIKQAIKLIASDMYYFREDRKRSFPMASEILLQPYKCYL